VRDKKATERHLYKLDDKVITLLIHPVMSDSLNKDTAWRLSACNVKDRLIVTKLASDCLTENMKKSRVTRSLEKLSKTPPFWFFR